MKKHGLIEIRLKSDLMSGSGYSYAGIIDSDVCFDDAGLPYIPARRLKGCLRDTAENILYSIITTEEVERLFGKWGNRKAEGMFLEDAVLENAAEISKALKSADEDMMNKYKVHALRQQMVLKQFSRVLGQTQIDENGAAKTNSLRYTRVVNHFSPTDPEKELTFYARVWFDSEDEDNLKIILRATRNIGMKRNRGIGLVDCRLIKEEYPADIAVRVPKEKNNGDAKTELFFHIRNTAPLMLSAQEEDSSETWISGQAMTGMLAAAYLERFPDNADAEEFRDLFLNGQTIYRMFYPDFGRGRGCPAPLYIRQLKKTKKIVNILKTAEGNGDYDPRQGNQPKKLKGKYIVSEAPDQVMVGDVPKQIYYHHSNRSVSADGKNGVLYTSEAVKAGTVFAGSIICNEKYADLLMDLIKTSRLHFGKSKGAQYGVCELLGEIERKQYIEKKRTFLKGSQVAVTFISDAVFSNGRDYTVYYDEVKKICATQLGISWSEEDGNAENNTAASILETKMITGYSGIWNLRKSPVPALKAGSCLIYKLTADLETGRCFTGEKNGEGFGEIRIDPVASMNYCMGDAVKCKNAADIGKADFKNNPALLKLEKQIIVDQLIEKVRLTAVNNKLFQIKTGEKQEDLGSGLGRVTLMLKESVEENRKDPERAFTEFGNRVESIKTDSLRRQVTDNILSRIGKKNQSTGRPEWKFNMDEFCKSLNLYKEPEYKILKELSGEEELEKLVAAQWPKYLITVLVQMKYKKEKKG